MASIPLARTTRYFRLQDMVLLLLLALTLLILFSVNISHDLQHDELYHMLAAKGMTKTGRPEIELGSYTRNLLITRITALSANLPMNAIASARLPSAILSVFTCCILVLWVGAFTNRLAAYALAISYPASPFVVDIAQYVRMYALQTFSFVLAAILLFLSLRISALWARIITFIAGLSLLTLSVSLNHTALMGVTGLTVWLTIYVLFFGVNPAGARRTFAVIGTAAIFYFVLLVQDKLLIDLLIHGWHLYRDTPLFGVENSTKFWFYHEWLTLYYPSLWYLTILLGIVGAWRYPGPVTLSISIFFVSFILASFAGPKGFRYIAFAMPFLFVIWCAGLSVVAPYIVRWIVRIEKEHQKPRLLRWALNILLVIGAAFFYFGNPAWIRTAAMLADRSLPGEVPPERWSLASEHLREVARHVGVVVATNELGALYYLGRADVTLSKSKLLEVDNSGHEFAIDDRTGLPVISTAESLVKLIQCKRSGLLIATPTFMRNDRDNGKIHKVLEERLINVGLGKETGLVAFRWEHPIRDGDLCIDVGAIDWGLDSITARRHGLR